MELEASVLEAEIRRLERKLASLLQTSVHANRAPCPHQDSASTSPARQALRRPIIRVASLRMWKQQMQRL